MDHSQSSVQNLLASTKTMGAELEAAQRAINDKSSQIIHLLQKAHNDTLHAKKTETALLNKEADLKRALRSAEWLAQTMQAKHESQLRELSTRCEALERRCQHMDILERQNVELCAIAREHLSQNKTNERTDATTEEKTLTSHAVADVTPTTSPPAPSLLSPGNRVAAAVTVISGLAIMSCAARD